jgi:5-methyltetrahydropteroyltriglutamate--homocysteine methyltransferase
MLEYDDFRSGTFEALREIPEEKVVVLGLVTTKGSNQETVEGLISQVKRAGNHFPLDQLAISTQCGFASSVLGNAVSAEAQRTKLHTVARTARAVWG